MQRGEEVLRLLVSGMSYKDAAAHLGVSSVSARSALMRFIKRAGQGLWVEGCEASDNSDTPKQDWIIGNAERIRQANYERDRFSELPLELRRAIELLSNNGYKVKDRQGVTVDPF